MITHFMFDLETLGNDTREHMWLSMGAVAFTLDESIPLPTETEYLHTSQTVSRNFYTVLDLDTQQRHGLTIDTNTLYWWIDERRRDVFNHMMNGHIIDIEDALRLFAMWVHTHEPDKNNRRLWSHGVTYDCMHLKEKWDRIMHGSGDFDDMNMVCPFRQMRDTRTLFDVYETKYNRSPYPLMEVTMKHHALFDAYVQACAVQTALRELYV